MLNIKKKKNQNNLWITMIIQLINNNSMQKKYTFTNVKLT